MGIIAAAVRELLAAGVTGDALVLAIERMEDVASAPRELSPGAVRTRRWRERHRASPNVTVTDVTSQASQGVTGDASSREHTRAGLETKTNNKNKEKQRTQDARSACVSVLESVLDPDHARAVVEHRGRMGKGKDLTPYSARLLADRLRTCPDPNAAADEMIARGWLSIKAGWLREDRPSTGPPGRPSNGNGFAQVLRRLEADDDEDFGRQIEGTGGAVSPGEASH